MRVECVDQKYGHEKQLNGGDMLSDHTGQVHMNAGIKLTQCGIGETISTLMHFRRCNKVSVALGTC